MKAFSFFSALVALTASAAIPVSAQTAETPTIEVSGSATVSIIPDRITVEIGMEEYYRHQADGDSVIVGLPVIERSVRRTLKEAGVPDSLIVVSDLGNYRNRNVSQNLLMAKRLSAVVSDFSQIDRISERLDRSGITGFSITKIDNTVIERYNREGLKAALDAAREKAAFIAANTGDPAWRICAGLCGVTASGSNIFLSEMPSAVSGSHVKTIKAFRNWKAFIISGASKS